ncbi:MAG: RNA methyltransferase [Candidatus Binatia bacterium]
MPDLLVALVHYPVYDKNRQVVTSAVTNIDVPDIARSCRTYGAAGFYVVTPVDALRGLVRRVMQHWEADEQKDYNPSRNEALALVRLEADLEGVGIDIERRYGCLPRLFATSARCHPRSVTFAEMREKLDGSGGPPGPDAPAESASNPRPWLMLLGTGSGLADEVMDRCEAVLEPVMGPGDYNHLSVRAAAAVLLDRLRCPR